MEPKARCALLFVRQKQLSQGPSRQARLIAGMTVLAFSLAAEQIPLSRLIVEDIMMKKDAEGGAPRDIFVVAQDEVSRHCYTQMHPSRSCLAWTKITAALHQIAACRDPPTHDRLIVPPASLALAHRACRAERDPCEIECRQYERGLT